MEQTRARRTRAFEECAAWAEELGGSPQRTRPDEPRPRGRIAAPPRRSPAPRPELRRRPLSAGQRVAMRPDRMAMWAVLMGLVLVLMTAATARSQPYRYEVFGNRTLERGHAGDDVKTLQRVLARRGFAVAASTGRFDAATERAVRRFQSQAGLTADGRVGPATRKALAATWIPRTASFFGPGLYGNRTACGRRLSPNVRGVAHRSLPCGARVSLYYAGRIVIVPVVDRGPFHPGRALDLTASTARALGLGATARVRAAY